MSGIAFPTPDDGIIARRGEIVAALAPLLPADSLIVSEDELRAFETDALTAYRRMPLAVVLPTTTEEVAAVLRTCHAMGVNVVPRGAGTSLCGGAIPQEDAVVLGLAKMNPRARREPARPHDARAGRHHEPRHQRRRGAEGFFYAPDPSSQLACTIGGNIAMNSGGAHCLKYGVTTNNILGVRMVLIDGTVVDIGGDAMDAPGYDLLALVVGSEGQLGVVTEAIVRVLPLAEGARAGAVRFPDERAGRRRRRRHHRRGHRSRGHGVHGQARHRDLRGLRQGRLSARRRGAADHRGRGIRRRDGRDAGAPSSPSPASTGQDRARVEVGHGDGRLWKGRKSAFGATPPRRRLHLHGRDDPHRAAAAGAATHGRDREVLRAARRQRLPRRTATCIR